MKQDEGGKAEGAETTPGWQRAGLEADLVLDLPGGLPMHFRSVPPGRYQVGARGVAEALEPRMQVELPGGLFLGTFPVTQAQFRCWTASAGIDHANRFNGSDLLPADLLTWSQASDFCSWLTDIGAVPVGMVACLPHEWLWEVACQAGSEAEYANGDGEASLGETGWYAANSEGRTHPVGAKRGNAWGFHDLHGNVWEWCSNTRHGGATRGRRRVVDYLDACFDSEEAGESAAVADFWGRRTRVLRGGSGYSTAACAASAYRFGVQPVNRFGDFGFRVCLSPRPEPEQKASGASSPFEAEADGQGSERGGTPQRAPRPGAGADGGPDWGGLRSPQAPSRTSDGGET